MRLVYVSSWSSNQNGHKNNNDVGKNILKLIMSNKILTIEFLLILKTVCVVKLTSMNHTGI